MPTDSSREYFPKLKLPLYTQITDPLRNAYDVGEVYEIRIEDPDRAEETDQDGPFNYVHKALLVAKEETTLGEIPGPLFAFDLNVKSPSEVEERYPPGGTGDDRQVAVLVFLRLDKAKEFVMDNSIESIDKTEVESF